MNIFQIKQPDFRPNEINRNGRTALLIDPHSDTNQSTSTSTVRSGNARLSENTLLLTLSLSLSPQFERIANGSQMEVRT